MTPPRIRWRWHAVRLPALLALAWVTLLSFTPATEGLDQAFRDRLLQLEARAPHPDIVIVAVDDKSLAALGRWPWPRSRHAELIANLTDSGARVIGMDLPLAEADEPAQDQAMAQAMANSAKVVLPMAVQTTGGLPTPALPAPALRAQALAIGHVHLPLDKDNQIRRVFLREGLGDHPWPQFAQALYEQTANATMPRSPWYAVPQTPVWHQQDPLSIAYAGPAGHFPRLSYVDVLSGDAPAEQLRGRLVLVGLTAASLGNQYFTPVSNRNALMPGVEVQAQVLDSLLSGRVLRVASPMQTWLFNLALVTVMFLVMVFWRLGPMAWLSLWAVLAASGVLTAVLMQRMAGLQLSPVPGLLALVAIGLLYWWQQWYQRTHYLTRELLRFRGSHEQIEVRSSLKELLGDPLGHRIRSLRELTQQLRDVHRFVRDSLDAQPDATLVCDVDGHIQLANTAAAAFARHIRDQPAPTPSGDRRSRPGDALAGQRLLDLLRPLHFADGRVEQVLQVLLRLPAQPSSVPATSAQGRDYLVKCVPAHSAEASHAGWVVSIVDVTDIHEAQRLRDQAIGFLSHDMRAPQSAILSLLELRRTRPESLPADQFEERVERHARKALSMSDGFIQLARAQSRDYRLQPLDLVDLVRESMDDLWEVAQRRHVALRYAGEPAEAYADVDRELFSRAVANLLGNAIKFSPEDSAVDVSVRSEANHRVVSVVDNGPGIDPTVHDDLFKPFFRDPAMHRVEGVGLGLPFVHAVMTRHGGRVALHSQPGAGSRFELWVPTRSASP